MSEQGGRDEGILKVSDEGKILRNKMILFWGREVKGKEYHSSVDASFGQIKQER